MLDGRSRAMPPSNEPVLDHAPGSSERTRLLEELEGVKRKRVSVPLLIDGERITTGETAELRVPHDHSMVLGKYSRADERWTRRAIEAALDARGQWSRTPAEERARIMLRAAELITGRYRARLGAVTMLSLSKTVQQAEIDVIAELADFLRFNVAFMRQIRDIQPHSGPGELNTMDWRPLEGFVLAISPFNFAAIAGNLPTAPALMGNTVVWKPASSAVYPAWLIMQILEEAGLPPGVINFVPGPGRAVGQTALTHPRLAGVHFTGSVGTFRSIWRTIGENIEPAATWPRLVGETGGKDFVLAHPTADIPALSTALVRGAFEYQGQKCSAASRAYIPASIWPDLRGRMLADLERIRVGDTADMANFMGAVIDEGAHRTITGYIEHASRDPSCEIIWGGEADGAEGWFVEPTVVVTTDPSSRTMTEEIFGPVLTIHVYDDDRWEETLRLVDETSPFGLTGAVFARDRQAISAALDRLRDSAGNFYVNDKPTGAVVGRQPFGGGRASGTNDKAGSLLNLLRWVSPRTVKESFDPPLDFSYPHMRT